MEYKTERAIRDMAAGMRKIRAILEASERRRMQAEMEASADREETKDEAPPPSHSVLADKVREHEVQLHRFNISYTGDKVIASTVEKLQHKIEEVRSEVSAIQARVSNKVTGSHSTLVRLQHQVDALQQGMEHVSDALGSMRKEIVELQGRVNGFDEDIATLLNQHLDQRITELKSEWTRLVADSSSPPMSSKVAKELTDRVRAIESAMTIREENERRERVRMRFGRDNHA